MNDEVKYILQSLGTDSRFYRFIYSIITP